VLKVVSTDAVGNRSTAELAYTVLPDIKPPTVECEAADSAWHSTNVTVQCAASDAGSGLAVPADTSFGLTTSVDPEEESTSVFTSALEVCDLAGNCSQAGPIGPFKIDRKAPTISIASPEEGEVVVQGANLPASYSCVDTGSGVASCEGSTTSDSPLPTLAPGQYTLSVMAVDAVGNTSSRTAHYTVVEAGRPPEFGRCEKLTGEKAGKKVIYDGKFTSATCVLASGTHTGKFEWHPGALNRRFTTEIKAKTKVVLETIRGQRITCEDETSAGEYLGLTQVRNLVFILTGCEMPSVKAACASGTARAGEVVSQPLQGALGISALGTTSATNKIGLELRPAGTTGIAMSFTCAGDALAIRGTVIVPVTTDKMLTANTWKATESKGKQKPEGFLGESPAVLEASLNGGTSEQAGLSLAATETSEEPIEINAIY
jgi:hypothetical protein